MQIGGRALKEIDGALSAEGIRVGLVVSRFNELVTERLLEGALGYLRRAGADPDDLTVVRVPGSFEIPQAARRLAESGRCDAVVCLGTLIKGETDHYDYLASTVTSAIARVGLESGRPVSYGVVTAATSRQALERAGIKHGNKGVEAAQAAIEMVHVFRNLKSEI